MTSTQRLLVALAGIAVVAAVAWLTLRPRQHNLIIFVADGLRSEIVSADTAPELQAIREGGVDFRDSHAAYPTVTTPNASAIATGHGLGDTGDYGNNLYVGARQLGFPVNASVAPVENDEAIGQLNGLFGGNYLDETTVLAAARARGYSTAAIGKLGPTALQDVADRSGRGTIVIDDSTGNRNPGDTGVPLSPEVARAIAAAGLATQAPDRGLNSWPGTSIMPGVRVANVEQQDWFVAVATKVVLPRFKQAGRPFAMVFWSRDPDGTQHNQGDSLNKLTPGINGPTSLAAIRNASDDLAALRAELKRLGLDKTTDIIVTADHGFSVASKASATSAAAKQSFPDVPQGLVPPGFMAMDLAAALGLPLYDPNGLAVEGGGHPRGDGALLGSDPMRPTVVVAANGGSDLIYLPGPGSRELARRLVDLLAREDYVGALFVDDALGPIPGALPLSAVGLKGAARTPSPAIVVGFKSFTTGCPRPETCAAEVADTALQQGQGIHGAFSRADTHNFMAAIGPDFRAGFVDPAPVSNLDVGMTAARLLGFKITPKGQLTGRVMDEALRHGGQPPAVHAVTLRSAPAANGFVTVLDAQDAEGRRYFDAAGAPGRTFGLRP
jgi:arylsulfatase A-like enzyme